MRDHVLLRSQKDSVYEVIEAAGFDPTEFEWKRIRGRVYDGNVPSLVHQPSQSRFVFDFDSKGDSHCAEWIPGKEKLIDRDRAGSDGWPLILHLVGIWLENVKRER